MSKQVRERGKVKMYVPTLGYGFLSRVDQPDVFVHRSQIEGGRDLIQGSMVTFHVVETGDVRGPKAFDVKVERQ